MVIVRLLTKEPLIIFGQAHATGTSLCGALIASWPGLAYKQSHAKIGAGPISEIWKSIGMISRKIERRK